ncbi:heterokaryon incompatibility protein-domain-containing protein [Immersiella caudata]|uniref:Heterokaryon incompatibility protein-domain-containing protein n=1 Tax=Immersiella caudata TaxID=314043 RepID=A0AA39TH51_9PEZI|nr:heterokaryon incompatibility protein-domain-containing protein [Immersiella caudata]
MATTAQTDPQRTLYRPIAPTEFRVVHVLPGAFHDEIRCVLEVRPPNLKVRYKALSYQWGDASITKPIQIAHLEPPPAAPSPPEALPPPQPRPLATRALDEAKKPYASVYDWEVETLRAERRRARICFLGGYGLSKTHQFLSWCVGTAAFYALFTRSTVGKLLDAPGWAVRIVSRDVYFLLLSMLIGLAPVEAITGARNLILEVLRTKPWSLASSFNIEDHPNLVFRQLEVTSNLESSLRYLRNEKHSVALWIDALCINQADEDEKRVQIQRMDWVYANAAPVIIWLGGYHVTRGTQECEASSDCEHRRQIQAAFDFIGSLSLLGSLSPRVTGRKNTPYSEALPGILELRRRGWWQRLWVVQEVALATGPVLMQCGERVCYLESFWRVHHYERRVGNKDLNHEILGVSRAAERFRAVTNDFKFSEREDQPDPARKLTGLHVEKMFGLFGVDINENRISFHKQDFPDRILRLLLRTAGCFKCQEEHDRFYAVLGIAARSRAGQDTKTRDFIRQLSILGPTVLSTFLDRNRSTHAIGFLLVVATGLWRTYYLTYAKHWAINRAEYVVGGDNEAQVSLMAKLKSTTNRAEFFTVLASRLATQTGALAFLDAAHCREDTDCDMPTWVPTWAREVSEEAYHFTIRMKRDGQARDDFEFSTDGKTLTVLGRPRGTVHVVRSQAADATGHKPTLHQRMFEKWLVLPSQTKTALATLLGASLESSKIADALRNSPDLSSSDSLLDEIDKGARGGISDTFETGFQDGETLLQRGGSTLVYSFDKRAREMGFLRAGEAKRGDRIVLVPGCYHHLILRKQLGTEGVRWRLVGLVEMGTEDSRHVACPETEWAQYAERRGLFKYAIV